MRFYLLLFAIFLNIYQFSYAQSIPTAQSLPYTQDFSSLVHSSTTLPSGWGAWLLASSSSSTFITTSALADKSLVANSSASTSSGNAHNYDEKWGFLNTNSVNIAMVLCLNTLSKKNILLQYDAMTIRNPYNGTTNTRICEMILQYRTDTTAAFKNISSTLYQNNTSTQTGSGVTTAQNLQSFSVFLPSDCDSQAQVELRWLARDVSGSGSRPSFALDNIQADTSSVLSLVSCNYIYEHKSLGDTCWAYFSKATDSTRTIHYLLSGLAQLGIDYDAYFWDGTSKTSILSSSGTLVLPPSKSKFGILFTPINDSYTDPFESIRFEITKTIKGYAIPDTAFNLAIIDDEACPIHLIQGDKASASTGTYNLEAVVTAVFPKLSPKGFYVQEQDLDADTNVLTSEGIFVVSDSTFNVGDILWLRGEVFENDSYPSYQQAVIIPDSLKRMGTTSTLPLAVTISLPLDSLQALEKWEAMRVQFKDTLYLCNHENIAKYGELTLSADSTVYQATQIIDPNDALVTGTSASGSSEVYKINQYNNQKSLAQILLDDGQSTSLSTIPYLDTNNTILIGSAFPKLEGIMAYAYDQYRIYPKQLKDVVIHYKPRPDVPNLGAKSSVVVASMNVMNYFNGDGLGGGFPTSRGASSIAEFTRQRDKIIKAILTMNADVIALMEIQNNGCGKYSAIQNLIDGINAYKGAGTYQFVFDGTSIQDYSSDEIRCALIYKTITIDTLGKAIIASDPIFNRPALAQRFKVKSCDSVFTIIANHFKSKGCGGAKGLDKDQGDGQGCYNDLRKQQAAALTSFINNEVLPISGNSKILSVGDYNSYFEEDPLDTLRAAGFNDLGTFKDCSYFYQGAMGSLDHAFATSALLPDIVSVKKWNINSVEPTFLNYEDDINDGSGDQVNFWSFLYSDSPYRYSDHDPILVGLELGPKLTIKPENVFPQLRIYPNPTTELLYIDGLDKSIHTQISVYNAIGQNVQQVQCKDTRFVLDLEALPLGVYCLKIKQQQKVFNYPFCKK